MGKTIRTILADDHALVLEGLKGMLEATDDIEVVATAGNGDELLDLLAVHEDVDVVVMDWHMPFHGSQALQEIRRRELPVKVLVLTAFGDGETLQSALELEAEGVVLKTESPAQTIIAVRQVAEGRLVFPRAAQKLMFQKKQEPSSTDLSTREGEVLELVAKGFTNPEIAANLSVSENTIRFHMKNIFEKLGVTNRTEAAAWYFKQQMPPDYVGK
ncbi:MAG: response regulator transcription factor [Chloroflexi bacterium]|nr:response regulator transcription factor [Chloroflexota bacterium]